ncbi:hypothetical protein PMI42_06858 [Bradyrhizobium sp. YR681]|uniref:hypothetical protein n=1 Tax=Bradyrhizobium sp. YR681 TaxID=1144344 RepID=UPI00026F8F0B|nr:hypothetical protein [Bradyrhizobium sp. YR681]EJN09247.1 hypothetical protein PMI42_06858 [Bradyrhizobium sp. YR681]
MTALAALKFASRNRLGCFALYALLQGVPFFSGLALMMKLINTSEFVGEPYGAAIFVAMASTLHALLNLWLGPKFPHFFRHSFEPLFTDPALSFSEKVTRWLAHPNTPLKLLSNLLVLSALAVGVAGIQ